MASTTYTYQRYMRDGTVKTITAVIRSKRPKKEKKDNNKDHTGG